MTQTLKNELLPVLQQIERDKGIKKEDILHMIEQALVSAYRKHAGQQIPFPRNHKFLIVE